MIIDKIALFAGEIGPHYAGTTQKCRIDLELLCRGR